MCPVCIASAAAIVAGAGSTGGFLAVFITTFRKLFRANRFGLFQESQENGHGNQQTARQETREWATRDEHTRDRVAAG
jgi:hypothetical protein